jgi:CRISPR-associated protein Csa3
MMATSHIIFVGLDKEWLIASIKQQKILPDEHILLVLGEQDLPGEETVQMVAEEIKSELGHLFKIKIFHVDKIDVIRAAGQITDLINQEKAYGNNIVLNASGSLRTFAIAAYIAGCLTQVRIFTAISDYVSSEVKDTALKLVELPTLPIELPKEHPLRILNLINTGTTTITGIIQQLNQNEPLDISDEHGATSSENLDFNEETQKYDLKYSAGKHRGSKRSDKPRIKLQLDMHKERGRLSHHLKNLEEDGFIQRAGDGKEINYKLTDRGKLVLKVRNEPKNERKPERGYNWRKHLKK